MGERRQLLLVFIHALPAHPMSRERSKMNCDGYQLVAVSMALLIQLLATCGWHKPAVQDSN